MELSDFDYNLPKELISHAPMEPREEAKLLVYKRETDEIIHSKIGNLPDFIPKDSYLVVNKSKVIKARILGEIEGKERLCEILLHKPFSETQWKVLVKPGKFFQIGSIFTPNRTNLNWRIVEILESGERIIETNIKEFELYNTLEEVGKMPLPPYIEFDGDEKDYQTPFGENEGSVAAPTASLHFTPNIISKIESNNVEFLDVTLHVGLGTFQPVKSETISEHNMHSEVFKVPFETFEKLKSAKSKETPVTAIGTTALRAIESIEDGMNQNYSETKLFLKPGDKIKHVDHLMTNFHLPKSTLLMLVACFLSQEKEPEYGIKKMHELYQEAIDKKYRFYSFGDGMLIL